jgi:predicted AAA+ superfamily ATPase
LEIQKGLTESITGMFQLTQAYHWNFSESQKGYGLTFEEYLRFGGYPGSYPMRKTKEWNNYVKNSIVGTVVEKDILQYQAVKSPALFRQAFEILIGYPAQEISYTKLLGQLQDKGNVELVKNYIRLYEGAFLIRALEKYSGKVVKTKSSSPKILPLAPCLYQLTIQDEYRSDERGRVFELAVGAQLVRTGEDLYYWREGKHEVDFILKKGRRIWAIEVKTGDSKSTKGLSVFTELYPQATKVLIDEENYFEFEKDPLRFLEKI